MERLTSDSPEGQIAGDRRQTNLSLPTVGDSPPVPPSQVSNSCEEGKEYNKQTLQVIDDDVDAPLPLEVQHSFVGTVGESKKREGLYFGGSIGTKPSGNITFSTSKTTSSSIHGASNDSETRNQNISQLQIQSQNLPSPPMNENVGINQNSQGSGSPQPAPTLQNDTPNPVPPFFAVEATLVENSAASNGNFPEPSAPTRETPVINAVIVDSSLNVLGNDDDKMSEKCSIGPDPTVSLWRRYRILLIIGILLVIIGALVGSIVSINVVGNNGGEPSETMTSGSSPVESSGGSLGESPQYQSSGPSPFQAEFLDPTSLPPPTLTPDQPARYQTFQPTTLLTEYLSASPTTTNLIPSLEPLTNPSSIPQSVRPAKQPTSPSTGFIPTKLPTKKPTSAPTFPTLAPNSSSQSAPNPTENPMIPVSGDCWNAFTFDNFESGVFPSSLWSTSGDGAWFIDDTKTIGGSYSIRSPDLSNIEDFYSVAQSNATIVTCSDFSGGSLLLNILAGVTTSSVDFLHISIDGRRVVAIFDGAEDFSTVSIPISTGRHVIDFSYNQHYIISNLSELFPSISDNFFGTGAVWLDNVSVTPGPAVAEYSPCLIGYCEVTLSDECFMKYKLNATEESLSIELFYNGIGWLGWGISNGGAMDGSEAVM